MPVGPHQWDASGLELATLCEGISHNRSKGALMLLLKEWDFASGRVGRNRMALAPMTTTQSFDDGKVSDEEIEWLRRRASGGFGMIITCSAHVTADGRAF